MVKNQEAPTGASFYLKILKLIFKIKLMKKGFAIVPLILGIIAILLLGGVGLEIIQTKQKISKAILEVQTLQKEKKFEEAIQKLENLENNFLVRYFGFGKSEIDREIEKIEKMIEQVKIEEEKKAEEEKKVEEEKEKTKEAEEIEVKDCKDNLDCLIESAKNCDLAKVKDRIFLKVGSYDADVLFFAEIRGKENGKCVLFVEAEKLYKLEKEGKDETQKWKSFVEGAQEICKFKSEDLVKWLETVKEGVLPSFEGAECQYRGIEILEIFPKL